MHAPGLLLASGLLVGAVVVAASQGIGMAYPKLRSRIDRLAPEDRTQVLSFLAVLPWLLAFGALLLAFLPSFVHIPGWIEDHCLPHEHHPHLCLVHGFWMPSGPLWGSVATLGLAGAAMWARLVHRIIRSHQVVRGLMLVSHTQGSIQVLPIQRAMAFTAGLLHPKTVVSKAVLENLEADELQVVLAHEKAHASRHDALWRVILEAILLGMPQSRRRLLLEDFSLASEEVCDRRAICPEATPDRVAEVLLRMQRLGCLHPEGALGATGSHLVRRVKALLDNPYPPRPWWMKVIWLSPLLLLLADPVHHVAESLLGLLFS
ncbi:MAG: M56 family metallopeptidase [Holophaga sp.]|nr:M56 family metallopeptidase [Holophaga sp.]